MGGEYDPEGDQPAQPVKSGTRVTIELEGRYQRGRGSVDEYLEQTAIANPHVTLHYTTRRAIGRRMPVRRRNCLTSRRRSSRIRTVSSWGGW
jgi:DNA topoisomerase VI subunit B